MSYIIGMDPGKRRTAVSVFEDRQLIALYFTKEHASPLACALDVSGFLRPFDGPACTLVQEGQQVYGEFEEKDPNDLLPLAYVNGAVAATSSVRGSHCPTPVLPREWKAGIPGKKKGQPYALIPRIQARLSVAEMAVLMGYLASVPEGLQHNVWDAAGIGLHGCGRGFVGSMRKRVIAR